VLQTARHSSHRVIAQKPLRGPAKKEDLARLADQIPLIAQQKNFHSARRSIFSPFKFRSRRSNSAHFRQRRKVSPAFRQPIFVFLAPPPIIQTILRMSKYALIDKNVP